MWTADLLIWYLMLNFKFHIYNITWKRFHWTEFLKFSCYYPNDVSTIIIISFPWKWNLVWFMGRESMKANNNSTIKYLAWLTIIYTIKVAMSTLTKRKLLRIWIRTKMMLGLQSSNFRMVDYEDFITLFKTFSYEFSYVKRYDTFYLL